MLPSDPESSRNGGTSTSSAGYTRNDEKRFSMVSPATTSIVPASTRTGSDSRAMRRRIGNRERTLATNATMATIAQNTATIVVSQAIPTRYVARNSAGSVTMSPAAVTMGDVTLSRSQFRRTPRVATPTVMAITTIDERKPPITEITTKSAIEMVFSRPNATEIALARTASTNDTDNDIEIDAARFWPTTVSRRVDMRKVPVCTAVPSRLPSAPNTLPRMPMAAGTRTRRPGRDSSVPVMEPSVSPARRSPPELMSSATKPARTPEASERSSARKRATTARHDCNIGTRRLVHFLNSMDRDARLPCLSGG